MSNFLAIVKDLAEATTPKQYKAAKRRAGSLGKADQFLVVDHFIACRNRLVASGVL